MALSKAAPVIYGAIAGLLMGGVGVAQVIITVQDYEARLAAFDRAFPPGYTGFRDATNLVRDSEWGFLGTGLEALSVIVLVLVVAATLAVITTRKSHTGVVTTLIAGAIGTVAYVAVNVIVVSEGVHPIASDVHGLLSGVAACFTVSATISFVLAWLTGLIGAGLGTLIGQRYPRH